MPNFLINVKEKGAKKAEKNIKGLNKSLGGLKSQAMLAAGAFLGAGALVAGIKSAINAFGEQELAEKKLEASLGRTSQSLLDQAAALQQVSTFGDETIISAQALIGAFVKDEEQIKAATRATLDLAAAKGMDLVAAADLVSKTLGSSTNALSRYGIEVTGAVGSTERLESLTGNLADVFGGQAKAQAETMSGSLDQMKNAIGDAAEAMGELLSPAVISSAKFFKSAAESIGGFLGRLKELTPEEIEASTNTEDLSIRLEKLKSQMDNTETSTLGVNLGLKAMRLIFPEVGDASDEVKDKILQLETRIASLTSVAQDFNVASGMAQFLEEQAAIEEARIGLSNELLTVDSELTEGKLGNIALIKESTFDLNKAEEAYVKLQKKRKEEQIKTDLRGAVLSGQSASQAMKSVVRAEIMEAVAGHISSIFKTVPFPLNIGLAAGAGALVSGLADKAMSQIPSFATGGDFVTSGEQLIMVGDNASGRERVQVTPLDAGGEATSTTGAVNITFNSPIMSADHTESVIIPQIKDALRRGASL